LISDKEIVRYTAKGKIGNRYTSILELISDRMMSVVAIMVRKKR
jgi:hypothetical protein